jgi:hypothetical protein
MVAGINVLALELPYPIYGYVKDSNGNPINGLTIVIKETVTGQIKTSTTDDKGRYIVALDNYRDGDEVQITAGNIAISKLIDVRSGAQVDLLITPVTPATQSSNWIAEETIFNLPNWILVLSALLFTGIGFTARLLKTQSIKARNRARDETPEYQTP